MLINANYSTIEAVCIVSIIEFWNAYEEADFEIPTFWG